MSDPAEDQQGPDAATAAADEQPTAAWSELLAESDTGSGEQPAAAGAHKRRPSSLRAAVTAAADVPRRRLTPPTFPGASSSSGSPATAGADPGSPVSEAGAAGRSRRVPNPGPALAQKLPLEQLGTLVRQRPEVGLGLAFAGGLVLATIIKRLGR